MGKRVALVPHFTSAQLAARYKATADAATARRWQLLWLISVGKTRDEAAPLLDAAQRRALAAALAQPPPDGGLWTGRKVAAWMAIHAGVRTNPKRGIVYLRRLGRTPQVPRPCHGAAAPPAEQAAFRKA